MPCWCRVRATATEQDTLGVYWNAVSPDMADSHGGCKFRRKGQELFVEPMDEGSIEAFFA